MKEKVILDTLGGIMYVRTLIEKDIQGIEILLKQRQEFLQLFNDRGLKNTK